MLLPVHHTISKTRLLAMALLLALVALLLFFISAFTDSCCQTAMDMETGSFFISLLCT